MFMNVRSLFGERPADPNPISAKRIDEIDSDKPKLIDIDCHAPSMFVTPNVLSPRQAGAG